MFVSTAVLRAFLYTGRVARMLLRVQVYAGSCSGGMDLLYARPAILCKPKEHRPVGRGF